ncbi:hypothetical protein Q3G72_029483 [Acer saccharum]|nr:hypothetical protein Q3G72_029483 [Acer saccharum]
MAESGWKDRKVGGSSGISSGKEVPWFDKVRHQADAYKGKSKSSGSVRGHSSLVDIVKEDGRPIRMGVEDREEPRRNIKIKWNASKEELSWVEFSVVVVLQSLKSSLRGCMNSCRILVTMAEEAVCPSMVCVETTNESFSVEVHEEKEGPDQWMWDKLELKLRGGEKPQSSEQRPPLRRCLQASL